MVSVTNKTLYVFVLPFEIGKHQLKSMHKNGELGKETSDMSICIHAHALYMMKLSLGLHPGQMRADNGSNSNGLERVQSV